MSLPSAHSELARLSISLPSALLAQLDAMVEQRSLPNRSQVIAELIRHELADHYEHNSNSALSGTITLMYRANGGHVRQSLAQVQSAFVKEIISSQHVFLESEQSLEVLLVQGSAQRLHRLCDALRKIRGVLQTKLVTTTALLPPLHTGAGAEEGSRPGSPASTRSNMRPSNAPTSRASLPRGRAGRNK